MLEGHDTNGLARKTYGSPPRRQEIDRCTPQLGPIRYLLFSLPPLLTYLTNNLLANLVLQSTIERIFVPPPSASSTSTPTKPGETSQPGLYADVPRGIFLVRGENVLLLGEIDLDKDDDPPPGYEKADVELVHRLSKERKVKDVGREKFRLGKLRALGFEGENTAEASL